MIITCPGCSRRFNLERRPPTTFRCPKCSFTAPFSTILNENPANASYSTQDGQIHIDNCASKTKVVSELANTGDAQSGSNLAGGKKTQVVPDLQQRPKRGSFTISFQGHQYGIIPLPFGDFEVGRNSSDSTAKVKLTPDLSMSRTHAGMRTVKINGQIVYQITSVKNDNPVYVNDQPIAKGKACNLKNGDQVRMGDTVMIFRMV